MQANGPVDINLTIAAWADIVLDKWRSAIEHIPVVDSGALRDSLKYTLFVNSGQNIEKIEFSFKLYGIFTDMGAGKNRGKKTPDEQWFSKRYYGQVMKLKEILVDKYSLSIAYSVANTLSAPFDDSLQQINLRNN